MVIPVALLLFGAILVYAGIHGESVADVLRTELLGRSKKDTLQWPGLGTSGDSSGGGGKDPNMANAPPGVGNFDGKPVANWIVPILRYARQHGWQGSVTSGYRSFADQTRIYNSGVRPAAKPGQSNHEGSTYPSGAVDVSNASQLSQILQSSPYRNILVWAGSKDPVHFSHPHGGGY